MSDNPTSVLIDAAGNPFGTQSNPFFISGSISQPSIVVNVIGPSGAQGPEGPAGSAATVTGTWRDTSSAFVTTGSVSIDASNRVASDIGTDVFFFVSGSVGLSSGATRKVAVFGGDIYCSGGLSGSLQRTSDGLSYLVAGTNVTITSASNGQITIASTAAGGTASTGTFRDAVDAFVTTGSVSIDASNRAASSIGTDVFFFVSGSKDVVSGVNRKVVVFGGDVYLSGGLSGSIQQTSGGLSYLVAGANITIVSASNGQITITGAAGSSAVVTGTFRDPGNTFVTTGSVSVDKDNREVSSIGTDVFFFVSGSVTASSGANRKVAVFGGDVVASGTVTYLNQVTSGSHQLLRQLIHLAGSDGPKGNLWPSNLIKDAGPQPFPTASIWWTDVTRTSKIVEKLITRNGNQSPATIQWKVYDTDGVTVVESFTDTIEYNGVYELSRSRSIP